MLLLDMSRLSIVVKALKAWARGLIARVRGYEIKELYPAEANFNSADLNARINLVVLGLASRDVGGTSTAIRLLETMAACFSRVRIVVIGEDEREFEASVWEGWELASRAPSAVRSIDYLSPGKRLLSIGPNDYFIATQWRTAHFVFQVHALQHGIHNRVIYLIQDFEPGFYSWGSLYAIADSTYHHRESTIAVFNTRLLSDYFERYDYRFFKAYTFEPSLNPVLAVHRLKMSVKRKRRLLLVYGRPNSQRNAFTIVVAALKAWAGSFPCAGDWEVVSLGEKHMDIVISAGVTLHSKGKVSLDAYSSYLLEAAVGLSLMISPHPSYPPLEMAEFAVRVVTNSFANKDLSTRSSYITSVPEVTPQRIAAELARLCKDFDSASDDADLGDARGFLGGENEFPFIEELMASLVV